VYVIRENPKEFVMQANNDSKFVNIVKQAFEKDAKAGALTFKNSMYLERGPYDVVSVLNENPDKSPYHIKGPVIDLFDPQLPVLAEKTVNPGEQSLLYDVKRVVNKRQPKVLASASRVYEEKATANSYSFVAKSPAKTLNSMRIILPAQPKQMLVSASNGQAIADVKTSWDTSSNTLYLGFSNSPDGVSVNLKWTCNKKLDKKLSN
jgi:hypothetical protein